MDTSAILYFEQKFGAYDSEELGDLVARRHDLSDEAIDALDRVLAKRGLKDADVFVAPQPNLPRTPEEESAQVEVSTKMARELWRGGLATSCKFLSALVFLAPIQILQKTVSIGALWSGLLVLFMGYAGYRVGNVITRNICANADVTVKTKTKNLWILFAILLAILFIVYAVSSAAAGRG